MSYDICNYTYYTVHCMTPCGVVQLPVPARPQGGQHHLQGDAGRVWDMQVCVVVFDEAHKIDNVCIEAMSTSISKQTLKGAEQNMQRINQDIDRY